MKSKIIFWSTKFAILVLFLTLSIPASTQPYQPIIAADSTSWDVAHQELFGIVMEQLYTKKHPAEPRLNFNEALEDAYRVMENMRC